MGLRYRKSINVGCGFRINISKSGIGYSWGGRGFRMTKTANGRIRQTYSLPGTGLSYTKEASQKSKRPNRTSPAPMKPGEDQKENLDIANISKLQPAEFSDLTHAMQKCGYNDFDQIELYGIKANCNEIQLIGNSLNAGEVKIATAGNLDNGTDFTIRAMNEISGNLVEKIAHAIVKVAAIDPTVNTNISVQAVGIRLW